MFNKSFFDKKRVEKHERGNIMFHHNDLIIAEKTEIQLRDEKIRLEKEKFMQNALDSMKVSNEPIVITGKISVPVKNHSHVNQHMMSNMNHQSFNNVGSSFGGFFEEFTRPSMNILKDTSKLLNMIPDILDKSIDVIEEIPDIIDVVLRLAKKLIQTLPNILNSLEKLLEITLSSLEWTLDDKNKSVVLASIVILFIIWAIKDNSLIRRLKK